MGILDVLLDAPDGEKWVFSGKFSRWEKSDGNSENLVWISGWPIFTKWKFRVSFILDGKICLSPSHFWWILYENVIFLWIFFWQEVKKSKKRFLFAYFYGFSIRVEHKVSHENEQFSLFKKVRCFNGNFGTPMHLWAWPGQTMARRYKIEFF